MVMRLSYAFQPFFWLVYFIYLFEIGCEIISVTLNSLNGGLCFIYLFILGTTDSERVRVAVRVRPRNAEELLPDSDFVDYIELQPEVI